jgi:transketolase
MGNPREAYGRALADLSRNDSRIWALDADLNKSTMSCYVEQEFPQRYVEAGIAEANMVGMAAGLALCGKIPFASSFAVFMTGRVYDQIRQSVCIPRLNVKFCGSSAGLSDYGDGSTHQTVEDIALMRALPNMAVLCPGDARQTYTMVKAAACWDGPVYMRVTRSDMEDLPGDGSFEIGRVDTVRKGSDVTVFATGIMVCKALQAAKVLEAEGISALVANISTIKPLDASAVRALAKNTGLAFTCEEHSVIGGLGSAVAEALSEYGVPVRIMGIKDTFGQSSNSEAPLMEHYGLTAENIAHQIRDYMLSGRNAK